MRHWFDLLGLIRLPCCGIDLLEPTFPRVRPSLPSCVARALLRSDRGLSTVAVSRTDAMLLCPLVPFQPYVLLPHPHTGTSHCLEPASLAAEVARQLPQETPGGTAFGVPFHQPHHARSMPPPGSPTEDAMLCSRHSSSSFASASGCSRSSSGTPGLATECGMVDAAGAGAAVAACGDGGQLVGTGVLPAWVALHHKVRRGHVGPIFAQKVYSCVLAALYQAQRVIARLPCHRPKYNVA